MSATRRSRTRISSLKSLDSLSASSSTKRRPRLVRQATFDCGTDESSDTCFTVPHEPATRSRRLRSKKCKDSDETQSSSSEEAPDSANNSKPKQTKVTIDRELVKSETSKHLKKDAKTKIKLRKTEDLNLCTTPFGIPEERKTIKRKVAKKKNFVLTSPIDVENEVVPSKKSFRGKLNSRRRSKDRTTSDSTPEDDARISQKSKSDTDTVSATIEFEQDVFPPKAHPSKIQKIPTLTSSYVKCTINIDNQVENTQLEQVCKSISEFGKENNTAISKPAVKKLPSLSKTPIIGKTPTMQMSIEKASATVPDEDDVLAAASNSDEDYVPVAASNSDEDDAPVAASNSDEDDAQVAASNNEEGKLSIQPATVGNSARPSFELQNTVNDFELLKQDSNVFLPQPERVGNRRSTFDLKDSVNHVNLLKCNSELFSIEQSPVVNKTLNESQASASSSKRPSNSFVNQNRLTERITKKKRSKEFKKSVLRNLDLVVNDLEKIDVENVTPSWMLSESNATDEDKLAIPPPRRSMSMEDSVILISSDSEAGTPPSQGPYTPPVRSTSVRRKNRVTLLKQTLIKKWNSQNIELGNSPSTRKIVPTKMPNFNLIHQKTFAQMEDIEALSKRKEERAKVLLSGKKPLQSTSRNNVGTPTSRKKLYEPAGLENAAKKVKFSNAVALISSPGTPVSTNTPRSIIIQEREKTPIPKPEDILKRRTREGFTRYGFKKPVIQKASNEDLQKQAVANKCNIVKSHVAGRREIIKGVRSNRRFELLMQMRNK